MLNLEVMGDPHLGKTFIHGVPLHRRGDREEMVWAQFEKELRPQFLTGFHVNLGDLFDAAIVPYDVILRAAELYRQVATELPGVEFIILKGNHDLRRDLERASAFDLFTKLVADVENIKPVVDSAIRYGEFAFAPFHPITPAADLLTDDLRGATILFGHYDVESFGQTNNNLIPTERAAELNIPKIITGHVHKPSTFTRDDVDVVVHGSLQPYAHGQEVNDDLYITLSLDEVSKRDDLKDKVVRVLLKSNEVLETEIDCLQLSLKREGVDDSPIPQVDLGVFDFESIFTSAMEGVSQKMKDRVLDEYQARRLAGTD